MKVSVNKVKIDRFVNYEMRYSSTGFESKTWFALGPKKLPGRLRNRPQWTVLTNNLILFENGLDSLLS